MKKAVQAVIIVLALAAVASAANGPVDKGSFVLGGHVSFMAQSGELHESPEGDNYTSISVSPSLGYFVLPGFYLGMDAGIFHSWQGNIRRTTGYLIGPSLGFYYDGNPTREKVKGAVYPFLKAFFYFQQSNLQYPVTYWDIDGPQIVTIEATSKETRFGAELGGLFMVSNAVGINLSGIISSEHAKWTVDYSTSDDSNSGLTFMLGAGVTYFIY